MIKNIALVASLALALGAPSLASAQTVLSGPSAGITMQSGATAQLNPNNFYNAPSNINVSAITSSLKMGGLGSTWQFTPNIAGNIKVTVNCDIGDASSANEIIAFLRYADAGVTSPPANNAADTGTSPAPGHAAYPAGTGYTVPLTWTFVLNLTAGNTYWFDFAVESTSSSQTIYIYNPSIVVEEYFG